MTRATSCLIAFAVSAALPLCADELDLLPLGGNGLELKLAAAPAGSFFDTAAATEVSLEELAAELVKAQVVLLGESHTDMAQKKFHGALFEAMAELKPDLVLGMEFFLGSDDEDLEAWGRGEIDETELLRQTGWYDRGTYNFGYYRPIMDVARARGIPVVGLNVPREIPRAVNRGGLESLTDEQRAMVGEVAVDGSDEHRYLISRYFGETVAMLPPGWFDNMYAAQCLWDVVMARSILAELGPGETMVVVVGSGHVAYGLGIARRIHDETAASGDSVKVSTFCPVTAPPPDPDHDPMGHPMGGHGEDTSAPTEKPGRFTRSIADFVGVFPDTGGVVPYPTVGLRLGENEGEITVSMVWPDTAAASAGFESGDRILDLNGNTPSSLTELREWLAATSWNERLGFLVERDGSELEIGVLLYPEVDLTEPEAAPGWTVEPIGDFDPRVPLPVIAPDGPPAARRVLVEKEDGPGWVEVWFGDVLEEVHELDADSLVVRSLYRTAKDDGTVEVRYLRGANGAVVDQNRFDRTGATLK